MPGCASSQPTIASAARQTHSVQVSRIGVSSSPSSATWVTPSSLPKPLPTWMAAGTRSRKALPGWGRMAVTPVRTESPIDDGGLADADAGDVGDRVQRARREGAGDDAEVAGAGALLGASGRGDGETG